MIRSDQMFMCPKCGGPHFNITVGGTLLCASVTKFTNYKVMFGGCGWKGTTKEEKNESHTENRGYDK